tara:strand:- start:424 stop:621 length:198 start_codon:yes stop_codon:yes gene_type:complete
LSTLILFKQVLNLMMNLENIQNKVSRNESFQPLNGEDHCKVSEASVEIMLERFCNGREIDFPFSQ